MAAQLTMAAPGSRTAPWTPRMPMPAPDNHCIGKPQARQVATRASASRALASVV